MRIVVCSLALLALWALLGCGGGSGSPSVNSSGLSSSNGGGTPNGSGTSTASTGTLAGTVYIGSSKGRIGARARTSTKVASQTPLVGATVAVNGYPKLTTQTDSSGNFQISSVPTGPQTVTISASGYTTLSVSVTVQSAPAITEVTLPAAGAAQYQMDSAGVSGCR